MERLSLIPDELVLEKLSAVLVQLQRSFIPFLQQDPIKYVQLISQRYFHGKQPFWMTAGESLFMVPSYPNEVLQPLLQHTLQTSCHILYEMQLLYQSPDVVVKTFEFLNSALKTRRDVFNSVTSELVDLFFVRILPETIKLAEPNSVSISLKFIRDFVSQGYQGSPIETLVAYVLAHAGQSLIKSLMEAIGGGQPMSLCPKLAEGLFQMTTLFPDSTKQALLTLLVDTCPSQHATLAEKQEFIKKIMG